VGSPRAGPLLPVAVPFHVRQNLRALPVTILPARVGAPQQTVPINQAVFAIERSQFLLCRGCTATRRCFTVAAGNNVRVAFLAAGAPRADQQMRSGTWYEIGTLFMRGSADGNLPLSRARHARRTPVTGPTIPEFARNPKPNQPSQDFMAYRSRN